MYYHNHNNFNGRDNLTLSSRQTRLLVSVWRQKDFKHPSSSCDEGAREMNFSQVTLEI